MSGKEGMNGNKECRLLTAKVTTQLYRDLQLMAAERRETPEHLVGGIVESWVAGQRLQHIRPDLPHKASLSELRGCVPFKPEGSVQ